ncbi:hypothetical protein BH24ACT22_BH24ACT22_07400 [soil metagenome]
MKEFPIPIALLLVMLATSILAAGCGAEQAREAGERAAEEQGAKKDGQEPKPDPKPENQEKAEDQGKAETAEPEVATDKPQASTESETVRDGEDGTGTIRDLRVCGEEDFDPDEEICTVDRSEEEVTSSEFYCSAQVYLDPGETVDARWEYEGEEIFALGPTVPEEEPGSGVPLHAYVTLGPQDNPDGDYRCAIEAGDEEASVTLESGGPEGRVVNAAVCRAEDLVAVGGTTEVCAENASGEVFDAPEELACSATYTDVLGEDLRFEMFYDGSAISATEYTAHFEAASPTAVISGYLSVPGEEITLEPGPMPPGKYSCRFMLDGEDGEVLEEVPFEVSGSSV